MCADELHKFIDGTLNDVRTALYDIATGIRMEYLPIRKWSNLDKKKAWVMVQDIDKQLYQRRLMRNLEKFVGGREYGNDRRLLERAIRLCHILYSSLIPAAMTNEDRIEVSHHFKLVEVFATHHLFSLSTDPRSNYSKSRLSHPVLMVGGSMQGVSIMNIGRVSKWELTEMWQEEDGGFYVSRSEE
ncbi:hypothetical protein Tco_0982123 [Tanacetum coccineum]